MADFKSSLAIGLNAAKDAERRRLEIQQVIFNLDKDVQFSTNNLVQIIVGERPLSEVAKLVAAMNKNYFPQLIIMARSVNDPSRFRELTEWTQSSDGYPCSLAIENIVYSCEDRDALEDCLNRLLQNPGTGEKIYSLMQKNPA